MPAKAGNCFPEARGFSPVKAFYTVSKPTVKQPSASAEGCFRVRRSVLECPQAVGEEVPEDNQRSRDELGGKDGDALDFRGRPSGFQEMKLALNGSGGQVNNQ